MPQLPMLAAQAPLATGPHLFPARGAFRILLLSLLFTAAFGIRLYRIGDPPLDFHPVRQYRAALLARAMYFERSQLVSEEQRVRAEASKPQLLEAPIMEHLAVKIYQIAGGETLVGARLISIICWMIGGIFLYRLARLLLSADASIVSTAFYLFLPFGLSASRSFQPDSLMVMLLIATVESLTSYRLKSSISKLCITTALAALAILVKPVCIFPIWLTFLVTGSAEKGFRSNLRDARLYAFLALSLLPTLLFYGYQLFVSNALKQQANGSFLPALLAEPYYWRGWLYLAFTVIGYGALSVVMLGVVLARSGLLRTLFLGLWGGYLIFGLVFTWHSHTHNYYHMMLIPVAALSLAAASEVVLHSLASLPRYRALIAKAVVAFALLPSFYEARHNFVVPDWQSQIAIWESIGEWVGHSSNTIMFVEGYGMALQYHARIAGSVWPSSGDLRFATLNGGHPVRGKELLDKLIFETAPSYFIVTRNIIVNELDKAGAQTDLKAALAAYPILVATKDYEIYELGRTHGGVE